MEASGALSQPAGPVVAMRGIVKRFPGIVANRGVDFDLRAGEVHALLGENGAGKSTLMNILAGSYRPDAGEILVRGQAVQLKSPAQAIAAGIGMVHQHFRLVETLTVAENLHLGWERTPWRVSEALLAQRAEAICGRFGLAVHPRAKVWQLATGEQQRVEILRVLARGAQVLILDEPTAVLTPHEADELFRVLRAIVADGHAVVFISHKLDEVLEVSDRVSVLRGGRRVDTRPTGECNRRLLANLMVGQEVVFRQYERRQAAAVPVVELREAHAVNDRGLPALVGVNLLIRSGEIVGIAGVAGNGQRELAEALTGLRPLQKGRLLLDGQEVTHESAARLARAGVGHIPEDRNGAGLVVSESITHNAILRHYARPPLARGPWLARREAARFAEDLTRQARVRAPNVNAPVRHLSGGNQQRLVARRELLAARRFVVAASPTRGLDVSAADDVQRALVEHRNAGGAVLLISEDLDEVLALSDRILVMCEGRIVGEFEAGRASRQEIGLLMGGVYTT